jgi:hypothetical protein
LVFRHDQTPLLDIPFYLCNKDRSPGLFLHEYLGM